nr:response regulator transcription factor [Dyella humicola]
MDRIIRILLVDDHPMMREGLRSTLEKERDMKVVGEASDGDEALRAFRDLVPAVTLMDIQMPRIDGLQTIADIRREYPRASLVMLTTFSGDARVCRAIELGATSYLLKTASSEEIVRAVRLAADGKRAFTSDVSEEVSAYRGNETLSGRELAVLRLVAQGHTNRSIGDTLLVSEDTIKTRMKSILAKLGANDRAHAVTIAMRRGFLSPP